MKIVTLTMVSLKIAKSVSMPKEVMAHAMVILVDLLLLMEFMLVRLLLDLLEDVNLVLLMPLPELVTSEIGLGKRLEFNLIYYPKQMFMH